MAPYPILPDELLIKIIQAYVKPYTTVDYVAPQNNTNHSRLEYDKQHAAALQEALNLNNLRLVNKMFHDEIQLAIEDYFDGDVFLDSSNMRLTSSRITKGDLFWLRPHIRVVSMDIDLLSYTDREHLVVLLEKRVTPNLENLVLFFNATLVQHDNRMPQGRVAEILDCHHDDKFIEYAVGVFKAWSRGLHMIRNRKIETRLQWHTIRINDDHILRVTVEVEHRQGGDPRYLLYVEERKMIHVDDVFKSD